MNDKIRLWEVLHGEQATCDKNCKFSEKCGPIPMKAINFWTKSGKNHYIYCDKWKPRNDR